MTYSQMIDVLSEKTGQQKNIIKQILTEFQKTCLEELKEDNKVKLPLLGTFILGDFKGRSVKLKDKHYSFESFKIIKFKQGKKAKDFLN